MSTLAEVRPDMGLSLFQIEAQLIALLEFRDEALERVRQSPGDPASQMEYEAAEMEIRTYLEAEVRKVDNIAEFLSYCETMKDAAAARIAELKARADAFARKREQVLTMVHEIMLGMDKRKLEGKLHTFAVKANPPSVEITDESLIPLAYKRATVEMPGEMAVAFREFFRKYSVIVENLDSRLYAFLADHAMQFTFTAGKKEIAADLKKTEPCPVCEGVGILPPSICPECAGTRVVRGSVAGARLITDRTRLEVK